MSFTDEVLDRIKEIEELLEVRYRARGKGLTEKIISIQGRFNRHLIEHVKDIARTRNAIVHERTFSGDHQQFLEDCCEVLASLQNEVGRVDFENIGDVTIPLGAKNTLEGAYLVFPIPPRHSQRIEHVRYVTINTADRTTVEYEVQDGCEYQIIWNETRVCWDITLSRDSSVDNASRRHHRARERW